MEEILDKSGLVSLWIGFVAPDLCILSPIFIDLRNSANESPLSQHRPTINTNSASMKRSIEQIEASEQESKEEFNNDPMRPQKRFFRSRAHCNPLSHNDSFAYPLNPDQVPWQDIYPNIPAEQRVVRILDMGMGFGGLTVKLSELFPTTLVLGMEIRAKVGR
ncbi:hypothetical protein EON63_14245 [archaeon]|nr:MAG: hypothetical protein EON63_14245 [archaeon]